MSPMKRRRILRSPDPPLLRILLVTSLPQHSQPSRAYVIGASRLQEVADLSSAVAFVCSHRGYEYMPEKETIERAHEDAREGKSPSTQAGEFVREEMHHVREGKHGAASTKQAIAIGLSKARRAGVKLAAPRSGQASAETREKASRDLSKGKSHSRRKPSARRSRAASQALKRKGRSAASPESLAEQARGVARKRRAAVRHRSAMKAVQTKRKKGRSQAARKAAQTRAAA